MKRMHYLIIGSVVAVVVLVGSAFAAAPGPNIDFVARSTLGSLDASNNGVEVNRDRSADHVVAGITFPPGSSIGWHKHPGVVLVTVVSGSLQHVDANCERETFHAGEGFVEEGDVHLARNVGDKNAVVYATWIIPTRTAADGLTIPKDAPKGCDVQ
jgi:quercetin dioxygenase-like cupin family protein